MAEFIIMPKQGLQMTEGTIMEWLVGEGEEVIADAPLFEMETDKLTISIDASISGTLLKIIHEAGAVVPITEPIAIVGDKGEDFSALLDSIGAPAAAAAVAESAEPVQIEEAAIETATVKAPRTGRVFASPRAKMLAEEKGIDVADLDGSGPEGLVIEKDVLDYVLNPAQKTAATPLARKIAELENIDINGVQGSGVRNKVLADDVRLSASVSQGPIQMVAPLDEELIPIKGMRKIVAERMKQSLGEMAQANHRITVDMTNSVALREQYKAVGRKVSYNDIVLRCVAKALTEFPMMNSSWTSEGIVLKKYVNMGMAVAIDQGLIVPVIKNIHLKSLDQISKESSELASKAKENRLQPEDYSGGTFTVSNLGMFDIDGFTAIINPPEAGILAVGKLAKQPVVIGDEIVIRMMMQLSLTYDHRTVDGAPAAQFLKRIKELLENPMLLI
ncbi:MULTISPECIES: 2-oxo acid dehydrogenase subunit E2 [Acetobacterium]|jgi:pyruvate dehydrogenase E2 component (dihydrolipoamide acetyltransferase)|uniref:Dihydrolipoamide acetyltransferase component of pyruvate dehydrogenase complex n=1 Tax=Acetobacterium wieringae TaxID=52694 RepID=A0A1F2PHY4_9FIRM|nr:MULTISPECIES: 2-oxo acid dehydrogenase subunit E2 [Acetobacterium]MEA4807237.1 2-oxo acid dehydrogenase subunit E2 [Acetobacterium wieringae]OFV70929.1 dihydrolipoyllysine-residue acetyltransferase component of pyruvate dehydrogenase complex [Acetobacterium wieringae]VUZ23313.1 Dihydrolipoyllysine-residue acetyltransferase component of pyruvate dehydrogenase complex [Acetobacterium wieringae]